MEVTQLRRSSAPKLPRTNSHNSHGSSSAHFPTPPRVGAVLFPSPISFFILPLPESMWNAQCSQTSAMIAGFNRSVARANNGSKGPRYRIDDDERQQSAMGTQKGAAMHSRHSIALQENGKIHCLLHGRRLHRCRTPASLLSHHQSTHIHAQHHYPGITPIAVPMF